MSGQQANEVEPGQIEVAKTLCASLIRSCSQRLGLNEPTINWAVEYERSAFRHVALIFFRTSSARVYLDAGELANLLADVALQEALAQKIQQQLEKSLESIL